ncbi:MAG: hypothetical protein ACRDYD_10180 [Acidimicrobiales bacterium]
MPSAAVLSFRLGGPDGVSVEAAKWVWALSRLGFSVRTVAGSGTADVLVPGLGYDAGGERREPSPNASSQQAPPRPDRQSLLSALEGADLVVVENVCSLPLNPGASRLVASALEGRPALMHHHDLAWQRPGPARERPGLGWQRPGLGWQRPGLARPAAPPDDPAWSHVAISDLSRTQLARAGIEAVTIYNAFDPDPAPGRREVTRAALHIGPGELLLLQPTRALARKRVASGILLATALGATYWLLGPAEDGYQARLEQLLESSRAPVRYGLAAGGAGTTVADAYAACDAVALPSGWEGFGNPALESAVRERPLAIGRYPVAAELAGFGFQWFPADDPGQLRSWLESPDRDRLAVNHALARRHFSIHDLPARLARALPPGALPPGALPSPRGGGSRPRRGGC